MKCKIDTELSCNLPNCGEILIGGKHNKQRNDCYNNIKALSIELNELENQIRWNVSNPLRDVEPLPSWVLSNKKSRIRQIKRELNI